MPIKIKHLEERLGKVVSSSHSVGCCCCCYWVVCQSIPIITASVLEGIVSFVSLWVLSSDCQFWTMQQHSLFVRSVFVVQTSGAEARRQNAMMQSSCNKGEREREGIKRQKDTGSIECDDQWRPSPPMWPSGKIFCRDKYA